MGKITWGVNRQKRIYFGVDSLLPVGITVISPFTHAVHGRLRVQTVPMEMRRRVVMKGEC
jgi:hypothetical protein